MIKKLLIIGLLSAAGVVQGAPASLSVVVSSNQVISGRLTPATIVLNTGGTALGGADFLLTFNPQMLEIKNITTVAPQFNLNFFLNTAAAAQGTVHVVALNGASNGLPSGNVVLATMTFIGSGIGGVPASFGVQALSIVDTTSDEFAPVTVNSTQFSIVSSTEVDSEAPRTSLHVGPPTAGQNPVFVNTQTLLSLTSIDDRFIRGDALGVGVAETRVSIDSAPFVRYDTPFGLVTPGAHSVRWYSEDAIGNLEAVQGLDFILDATPPVTTVVTAPPSVIDEAGTVWVSTVTSVHFTASDAGSGVAATRVGLDGPPLQLWTAPLLLPEGQHTLQFQSQDNVDNSEVVVSTTLFVDGTAPTSVLDFTGPQVQLPNGSVAITTETVLTLHATDPVSAGVASGVRETKVSIDGAPYATYLDGFKIAAEGAHTIDFFSQDAVANTEAVIRKTVVVDTLPPVSQVLFNPVPVSVISGEIILSTRTRIGFVAVDPGAGVAFTEYSLDGNEFQRFSYWFSLPEGVHTLYFRSQDALGHLEATQLASIGVDVTPPVTTFSASGSVVTNGNRYVSALSTLQLSATDPTTQGAATGIKETHISIDGAPSELYAGPFSLTSEGAYSIAFYSEDNAGNVEAVQNASVIVDTTPPVTQILISPPSFTDPSGQVYISSHSAIAFSAADSGAGVASTSYSLDGDAFQIINATIRLTEGVHTIVFRSQDQVGNVESDQTIVLRVDATAPATVFSAPESVVVLGSLYVSSSSVLGLTVADPVSHGVASGVQETMISVDRQAFEIYTATFRLSAEGAHTIDYFSRDQVLNKEPMTTTDVIVDNTPPVSSLMVGTAAYTAGASIVMPPATPVVLVAADALSGTAASFFAFDGAPFQSFVQNPLTLPFAMGTHTLAIYSTDRVGNIETVKTFTLRIISDTVAPVTQIGYSAAPYVKADGSLWISSTTLISFSATDAGTPPSGVALTEYALDGAAYAAYSAPLTLGEGDHILNFRSRDVAGNLEVPSTVTLNVDATRPTSLLALGSPQLLLNGVVYVNAQTPFTLSAADPLSSGIASGVAQSWVSLNAGAYSVVTGSFTLSAVADGPVTVRFYSTDKVMNAGAVQSVNVVRDATPPVTSIAASTPSFVDANGNLVIVANARITLSAVDPLTGGAASGVAFIQYSLDNAAYKNYTVPLVLTSGLHTIKAFSEDKLGNREVVKTFTVRGGDTTPPVSTLVVGEPKKNLILGILQIRSYTPLSISAVDPVDQGFASGVKESWVAIDANPFQRVTGTFYIPTPYTSIHIVRYYSRDNELNTETIRFAILIVVASSHAFGSQASGVARSAMLPGFGEPEPALDAPLTTAFSDGDTTITYHLEFAPGSNAQTGFNPVRSELGLLDLEAALNAVTASPLAPVYTVRLRSAEGDQTINISAVNAVDTASLEQGSPSSIVFGGARAPDLSPAFGLRDVFAFPNPARAGAKPTIHVEVGVADNVTLKIYDVSGRQVHEATLTQAPTLIDSGNGSRYAYEYLWDGPIPSGIYFYTVEAHKAGSSDLKAKGKIAVVR